MNRPHEQYKTREGSLARLFHLKSGYIVQVLSSREGWWETSILRPVRRNHRFLLIPPGEAFKINNDELLERFLSFLEDNFRPYGERQAISQVRRAVEKAQANVDIPASPRTRRRVRRERIRPCIDSLDVRLALMIAEAMLGDTVEVG